MLLLLHCELIAVSPPCLAWQSFPAAGHRPFNKAVESTISRGWDDTEAHRGGLKCLGSWTGHPNGKRNLKISGERNRTPESAGLFCGDFYDPRTTSKAPKSGFLMLPVAKP